jgi:alkylation response protein AidB-like acyl-CoA dehydrogenase
MTALHDLPGVDAVPTPDPSGGLDESMLERFRERAGTHDDDNTFFHDDLAELRDAGHLRAPLPLDQGGRSWDLTRVAAEQRRLARFAPATALATSMHLYWTGTASDLARLGDDSLDWVTAEAAAGRILASGHAEAGNDVPIALSTTTATGVDGGWRLDGRKHFGSLGPVWDLMGVHAMGTLDGSPVVVHGFVDRRADGVTVVENWDAIGMRASQSYDTVFDGVFLPDDRVARIVPAGDTTDPFLGVMQIWAVTLISNVYLGIAERAAQLAVEHAGAKSSIAVPAGTMSHNPFVQHLVADNFLDLHAASEVLDGIGRDWVDGVDHGPEWAARIFSAKWRAVTTAKRVVDRSMEIAGGASFARRSELGRLYRDVAGGPFHPASDAFTHEVVAKTVLAIAPDGPRW